MPGGAHIEGEGRWQRFFVWTARHNPNLVRFASKAVMAMCKRSGPEMMLRQLCKDSPSDMALLEVDEMMEVLSSNISLMAGKTSNAGQAFAMEFIAFHQDWSAQVLATKHMSVQILIADEDPTIDVTAIPQLQRAYPWMSFQVIPKTGLALAYQKPRELIPLLARAAKRAADAP